MGPGTEIFVSATFQLWKGGCITLYTTTNILPALHWVLGIGRPQSLRVGGSVRPGTVDPASSVRVTVSGMWRQPCRHLASRGMCSWAGRKAGRAREKSLRRVRCV